MKLTQLRRPMTESISHIEDLKIDKFIEALRNFEHYEISEKVDGSNIQFGIDEHGFYTSREDKGGKRMYDIDDHEINFATTYQRSTHAALEQKLPDMIEAGLSRGDRVEAEVLFGKLPNAVPYSNEQNEIILLRMLDGEMELDKLKDSLDGDHVEVVIASPYTIDGKTIHVAEEEHKWTFAKTPSYSGHEVVQDTVITRINKELDDLDDYLKEPSGIWQFTNAEVLSIPLNKRPESVDQANWKHVKADVKTKREEVLKHVHGDNEDGLGYKLRIKELLLNDLVRTIKSEFGPEIADGGWIEGVVFKHKETGDLFKVVDKDMFTAVKDFLWQVRTDLAEKPKSVDKIHSFLGKTLVGLGSALGHPELGTIHAKRHLKKHGGHPQEIVNSIADGVHFSSTQDYWESFIDQQIEKLDAELMTYKGDVGEKTFTTNFNGVPREFHYDDEIDKRTLQVFANMYKQLNTFKNGTERAKSPDDLVKLLVGRQLSEL